MRMYKVKYYIDNKDQVDGIKSHNDMYEVVCDVEAETEDEAICIAKDCLVDDIANNYYPIINKDGKIVNKLSYTIQEKNDGLMVYVEGYDDSFSFYFNFEAREQG